MKAVYFFGLRRGGNHGVLKMFFNPDLDLKIVHMNDTRLLVDEYNEFKNINITEHKIEGEYTGFKNSDYAIFSIENGRIKFKELDRLRSTNNPDDICVIALLRNPYNQLSSVWKVYNNNIGKTQTCIKMWIMYANVFLKADDRINKYILYDKFYTDKEYRDNIIDNLGLDSDSYNKNEVMLNGSIHLTKIKVNQEGLGED